MELYRCGCFGTAEELSDFIKENFTKENSLITRWRMDRMYGVTDNMQKVFHDYLNHKYRLFDTFSKVSSDEEMVWWLKANYLAYPVDDCKFTSKQFVNVTGFFKGKHSPVYCSKLFRDCLAAFTTWVDGTIMCKDELDLVKVIDITCMDSILSDIKNCVMYVPWVKSCDRNNGRSKHVYEYSNINNLHNYINSKNHISCDFFRDFSEDVVREKLNDMELRYYIGFYFEQKNRKLKSISSARKPRNVDRDVCIIYDWLSDSVSFDDLSKKYDLSASRVKTICNIFLSWLNSRINFEVKNMPRW